MFLHCLDSIIETLYFFLELPDLPLLSFVGFLLVHKRSGHVTFAAFTKLERHKALVVAIFSGIEAAHQMDERSLFESVLENSGEFGVSVWRVGVIAQPVQHFVEQ